jgi:hypothetical protein
MEPASLVAEPWGMSNAHTFVDTWSKVWRGSDSDPALYMSLLHDGCPLINPISAGKREDLPEIFEAFLRVESDIRVVPTRWGQTADGVLIEWVNTGTLRDAPFELRGADRFTLRDGKAIEGYSYFDPRPFLDGQGSASAAS